MSAVRRFQGKRATGPLSSWCRYCALHKTKHAKSGFPTQRVGPDTEILLCPIAEDEPGRRLFLKGEPTAKEEGSCGRAYWVGMDLGATNAKAAVISDEGNVLAYCKLPLDVTSNKGLMPNNVVDKLVECAAEALAKAEMTWADVAGVGVGSPGGLDVEKGIVVGIANLFPGCTEVPLCSMISKRIGNVPTVLVNDADAAVFAEMWVGVGRPKSDGGESEVKHMVFLTLGSGIGAGVVVDGNVVRGKSGTIEGGHHIIVVDGRPCTCGSRGCLEAYASANSVVRRAKEKIAAKENDMPSSMLLAVPRSKLTCKYVFDAAVEGDALANELVDDTAKYLAAGCINFFRILDSAVVVLSGGMVSAGPDFIDRIRKHIRAMDWSVLPINENVIEAQAGPLAGMIGAAYAARKRLGRSRS
eukprot:g4607.t1